MTVRSTWRGHRITEDGEGVWWYGDGVRVKEDPERACGLCGRDNTVEGHDRCLGTLPGVVNACCGHGVVGGAYVQFCDGTRFSGEVARAFFVGVRDA